MTAFVQFFCNTPALVQILWFDFAPPILLPFSISPRPAPALAFRSSAAFSAKIYRGGIESIQRGQWDGARRWAWALARRCAASSAASHQRRAALTNRAIEIFKMSTFASAVAYVELLQ